MEWSACKHFPAVWDSGVMPLTGTLRLCYLPLRCWRILHLTSTFHALESGDFSEQIYWGSTSCQRPSFLLEPLGYSESRTKWSFLCVFTHTCNAERLLIPLLRFSLFLDFLHSDMCILSCEATKARNVTQGSTFFHVLYFSQRRKKYWNIVPMERT